MIPDGEAITCRSINLEWMRSVLWREWTALPDLHGRAQYRVDYAAVGNCKDQRKSFASHSMLRIEGFCEHVSFDGDTAACPTDLTECTEIRARLIGVDTCTYASQNAHLANLEQGASQLLYLQVLVITVLDLGVTIST